MLIGARRCAGARVGDEDQEARDHRDVEQQEDRFSTLLTPTPSGTSHPATILDANAHDEAWLWKNEAGGVVLKEGRPLEKPCVKESDRYRMLRGAVHEQGALITMEIMKSTAHAAPRWLP